MTTTKKQKPIPVYDPNGPITTFQIKRIRQNCNFNEDIKCEWVQWVTGDVNRTSLKSLTQAQAIKIMKAQTGQDTKEVEENWAAFDKTNPRHKLILSLARQAQWTVQNEKWGEVADLDRLSAFLKSDKSPVQKPLKKMTDRELEKIIFALNKIVQSKYK